MIFRSDRAVPFKIVMWETGGIKNILVTNFNYGGCGVYFNRTYRMRQVNAISNKFQLWGM